MKLHSLVTIRGQVPRAASVVLGAIPIIVMFLLWWLSTSGPPEERRIAPTILPSPVEVVQSIPELVRNRDLFHHIWASIRRVGLSFTLSLIVMLPVGILMGVWQRGRRFHACFDSERLHTDCDACSVDDVVVWDR